LRGVYAGEDEKKGGRGKGKLAPSSASKRKADLERWRFISKEERGEKKEGNRKVSALRQGGGGRETRGF